jgi:hypothetical protein
LSVLSHFIVEKGRRNPGSLTDRWAQEGAAGATKGAGLRICTGDALGFSQQVGRDLSAAYVLGGSLRRAGNRLRINAQLMDAHTDFPVWSERYDREMKDVFEVQDEIARKIAEALRVTLSPQEEEEIGFKPTDNLQAYDLYVRGRSYARRHTRQDLEFALQMFENALTYDPDFALAHAAIANVCAQYHYNYERKKSWLKRSRDASRKAVALKPHVPEVKVAQAWIFDPHPGEIHPALKIF